MKILSDEEKRELREQRNLRIQEMKEVAAQQVINDLKRDMPEFEIQPEELKARDLPLPTGQTPSDQIML